MQGIPRIIPTALPMNRHHPYTIAGAMVLIGLLLPTRGFTAPEQIVVTMTAHAASFLAQLEPPERKQAQIAFDDHERENWTYLPASRQGLALKQMNDRQRKHAFALLASGLSASGTTKAKNILFLEGVLRELENADYRDPELYFLTIFGQPAYGATWGWRFEGHHLSLNFTIVNGKQVATAPHFWGANPAVVPSGPRKGLRTLAQEEDSARELVQSLSAEQRRIAVVSDRAPREIETRDARRVSPLEAQGISYLRLDPSQRQLLMRIIDTYLNNMPAHIAARRNAQIQKDDLRAIHFSWRGEIVKGQRHYYRIQGHTFLIEYDNYQNQANHIHAVWRDVDGDFGRDLLKMHLAQHQHER